MIFKIKKLLSTSFAKDVVKLSLGTIFGRMIFALSLPILTRIYTPDDFAILASYIALVSTISVVACLRLEIAIPLAKSDTESIEILTLALLAQLIVTIITLFLVLLMPNAIAKYIGMPKIAPFLWLVPIGVAFASSYSAIQYWSTRAKHFGAIAKTRIGQAIAGVISMLVLGLMGNSPLGLILGNILNMGAGGGALVVNAIQKRGYIFPKLTSINLLKTLIRNRRYPIFSMPEALLNIAGFQIPILIIASKAGAEAGFLILAIQLMAAPMALLGNSISQVYISRALKEYENGSLAFFTFSIIRRLILVGTGPLIILGVVAPIFFPSIFGKSWVRAGEIVSLLTPWMILQFIGSPVSMVMYVVGKDRFMLLLTSIGFLMRIGGVLSAIHLLSFSPVKGLVLASVCYYLLVISFVLVSAGISLRQFYSLLLIFLDWRVLIPSLIAFAIYCFF